MEKTRLLRIPLAYTEGMGELTFKIERKKWMSEDHMCLTIIDPRNTNSCYIPLDLFYHSMGDILEGWS